MIFVKRTFHPVGQGAFLTEQFLDDSLGTVLYNVVYDCGSKSSGIKAQMEREIRNCFHDKKGVDVLFLSHFDDDHINYVKFLKDEGFLQGTRVFIPMLAEEEWLGIEPYLSNLGFVLSLNVHAPGGTRVIQVEFAIDARGDFENRKDPMVIEDIEVDSIPSGTPLIPRLSMQGIIWYYAPFNVRFNDLLTNFKEKLTDSKLDYDRLKDKDYVLANKDELKRIYQSLGKKPLGGTAINLNSLLVMSYPKDCENCDYGGFDFLYYPDRYYRHRYYRLGPNCYGGSCLYTGDTSANESVVWNRIEQIISLCLGRDKRLLLLQIPHHGSIYSYDQKLLDSDVFLLGFTNFDPYYHQHIFDDTLPMKFAVREKPLILVTREYVSKFEEYWMVV